MRSAAVCAPASLLCWGALAGYGMSAETGFKEAKATNRADANEARGGREVALAALCFVSGDEQGKTLTFGWRGDAKQPSRSLVKSVIELGLIFQCLYLWWWLLLLLLLLWWWWWWWWWW